MSTESNVPSTDALSTKPAVAQTEQNESLQDESNQTPQIDANKIKETGVDVLYTLDIQAQRHYTEDSYRASPLEIKHFYSATPFTFVPPPGLDQKIRSTSSRYIYYDEGDDDAERKTPKGEEDKDTIPAIIQYISAATARLNSNKAYDLLKSEIPQDIFKTQGKEQLDGWFALDTFREIGRRRIRILSPKLSNVLEDLLDYCPAQMATGTYGIFTSPFGFQSLLLHFRELYGCWKRYQSRNPIEDEVKNQISDIDDARKQCLKIYEKFHCRPLNLEANWDEDTARHVGILLQFLAPMFNREVMPEFMNYAKIDHPIATYDRLWLLFRPGEQVYMQNTTTQGDLSGAIILSVEGKEEERESRRWATQTDRYTSIIVWSLSFNGRKMFRLGREIRINKYPETRLITELPVFPRYFEDIRDPTSWEKVMRDGKDYCNIIAGGFPLVNYKDSSKTFEREAIVDEESYSLHQPKDEDDGSKEYRRSSAPYDRRHVPLADNHGLRRFAKYRNLRYSENSNSKDDSIPMEESHHFLLPKQIGGMILKTKEWVALRTRGIEISKQSPKALQKLVLKNAEDRKMLRLVALMLGDFKTRNLGDADLQKDKGGGHVFLLHGPSGTGKTFSVECLAQETGHPLLSLTEYDLGSLSNNFDRGRGTLGVNVEEGIRKWFDLAARWNAILLIDEADIFLEQRRAADLSRNSLVTVFLRLVEYYRGILFLTTNRPGQIDDSFISRVTIAIEYQKATPQQSRQIWNKFFKHFREQNPRIIISKETRNWIRQNVEKYELNGREIRNSGWFCFALLHLFYHGLADFRTSFPKRGSSCRTRYHR
ncbi:hypothetical protein BGZ57DRAFT_386738 [Hyaloscypha finlandica]|nr:hypothetical protein BGZ57DRAFT_386738 [Hyaloscypha finlandica]